MPEVTPLFQLSREQPKLIAGNPKANQKQRLKPARMTYSNLFHDVLTRIPGTIPVTRYLSLRQLEPGCMPRCGWNCQCIVIDNRWTRPGDGD